MLRQKVMILYLANSALDSRVVGWTLYDGTGEESHTAGDGSEPPYKTGLHALRDGWRLMQVPQLVPPYPGAEYTTSFQKHEFTFERMVDVDD